MHQMHHITFDGAYVQSIVGRVSVSGTTREGRAFVTALSTDVRAQFTPTLPTSDAAGLRITIDGSTIPEIQLHRRIALRPLLRLTGTTCETVCGATTGNNETCPLVTYLEIIGIPDATSSALPSLRQITGSAAAGIFYLDTNPTDIENNNCGVSYEPGDRKGMSSPQVIISLRDIILSHSSSSLLPAVYATTSSRSVSGTTTDRTALLLLSGVVLRGGDGSPSMISLTSRNSALLAQMNGTSFLDNKRMLESALSIAAAGDARMFVSLDNCLFRSNTSPSSGGSALSLVASSIARHHLKITFSTFTNNQVTNAAANTANTANTAATAASSTSDCQLWVRTDSTVASKSVLMNTLFSPVLPSFCAAQTVTRCVSGNGMSEVGMCVQCPIGRFAIGGDDATCSECLRGQYAASKGSTKCSQCAAGKTSGSPSDISTSGTATATATATGGGDRMNGNYGVSGAAGCVNCRSGKYAATPASAKCTECASGTHVSSSGATSCIECATGKYVANLGSVVCSDCARGTFTSSVGATACVGCGIGKYTNALASKTCLQCQVGTYAAVTSLSACKPCAGASNITVAADGTRNTTTLGSVACARRSPVTPSSSSSNEVEHLIIPLVIVGVVVIVMFIVVMGYWVYIQKRRRSARMVNPNFPVAPVDEHGTELVAEQTPASIIQAQFRSHDLDADGHIDLDELINLVREIIGVEAASEDALQQISNILMGSVDSDGNGSLEQDEFTMLCLRVMRWPATDVDQRLMRMVPTANDEERELLKFFFQHMNRWFMRKIAVLRREEEGSPDGAFDPAEENSRREAESVEYITWN
jgi:hypothetical protein